MLLRNRLNYHICFKQKNIYIQPQFIKRKWDS